MLEKRYSEGIIHGFLNLNVMINEDSIEDG
jgi:hypothetical protein